MTHDATRVDERTYWHRWECSCGWTSPTAENGTSVAGIALTRHVADQYREKEPE